MKTNSRNSREGRYAGRYEGKNYRHNYKRPVRQPRSFFAGLIGLSKNAE